MPFMPFMPCLIRRFLAGLALAAGLATLAAARENDSIAGTLADELLADRVGLVREWIVQIPFDSAGYRLQHIVVADGMVIAQSGDGGVHAVRAAALDPASHPADGDTHGQPQVGTLLWSQRIGKVGGPVEIAGVGPTLIAVARDLDLYGLDSDTGQTRWHDRFGRIPAAGAMPSGNWVYVPLHSDGVLRLPVDPHKHNTVKRKSAVTDNKPVDKKQKLPPKPKKKAVEQKTPESLAPFLIDAGGLLEQAPIPLADGILWCTTNGTLVALERKENEWQRHQFLLGSPPAGPPRVRGNAIFATTVEKTLVRIDLLESGGSGLQLNWQVSLRAQSDPGVFLSADTLVVSLGDAGIEAFSTETGKFLWHSPLAGQILAANVEDVWCIDRTGRLASLDLADGSRKHRANLGIFSLPVVNATSDRLMLASPDGVLVSLAPRRIAPAQAPRPAPAK